jgi:thiol-disulfide isomerase/thioredoxin
MERKNDEGRVSRRYTLPLVIIIAVLALVAVSRYMRGRVQTERPYRTLPEICALTMTGDSVNCNTILESGKKTAILFFNPECEACKNEMREIIKNQKYFLNVQWLFITIAQAEDVESFIKDYPVQSIPDSYLFREDYPKSHMLFDVSAPPALFVYNEKGKLIVADKGENSIQKIARKLKRH